MRMKKMPVLLISLALFGCAKEKEYDTVYKDVDLTKRSAIKTHKVVKNKDGEEVKVPIEYMYVPMSLGTPMKVKSAYPFQQGDEKIVRLQWSESGLEVLEMERDDRFNDNELNDSPVMTIPVTYSSYRCREDQFGDCTNAEEENTELEWNQKDYFIPDFESIQVSELTSLDLFNVSQDACTSLQSTKLKDYEIADGIINIEVEKTFRLNNSFSCILQNWIDDNFSNNSFKVRFFYSLVELDKLASPDYKAVDYPVPDHDEFGFFKNKESTLSPDYDRERVQERYFLNRFNPNQPNGELVYHLSKNFNKPENAILLEATNEAVATMNKGLAKIGNPFKIVVKQQEEDAKEISPGDLRHNMIVLIEDPLSNGLLGYGPSVKNPKTGEILKAHTNMYGGVLKAISRRAYDEAVDISEEQFAEKQSFSKEELEAAKGFTVAPSALGNLPAVLASDIATAEAPAEVAEEAASEAQVDSVSINRLAQPLVAQSLKGMTVERLETLLDYRMKSQTNSNRAAIAELLQGNIGDDSEMEQKFLEFEKENNHLVSLHKHQPEFFPIGGTTKVVFKELKTIKGIVHPNGVLKRWDLLSQKQKDEAVNVIIKKAWIGTMVHELGHNLGLRHNFSGSHDRHNFLSNEDLQEMNIVAEERPAYSSIMDYAISEYNQLASFGNYDLAALRFAYKREVEVMDQAAAAKQSACEGEVRADENSTVICQPSVKIVKVDKPLSEADQELTAKGLTRKSYEFCTDENAGLSSTCNRFDEGTTLTEIAKFRAERYERVYKYRNFRDGRLDFSAYDIPNYVFARRYELSQIRDIIEEYEFFKGIFDKQDPNIMISGCSPEQVKTIPVCGMINDRIKSVEVVGDMLVNILKTPDHLCAVVKNDNPKVIVAYKRLAEIYEDIKYDINYVPKTCFDSEVKKALATEQLTVVGETGKFLNGFKDTNPNYRYVTDRAVLGTWPDKIMAMRALFNRKWKNRTTDRAHLALVDIPSISEKVVNVLSHYLMANPLDNPIPFKMESGLTFQAPYAISNDYKVEQLEDVYYWVKKGLGMEIGGGETNFIEMALKQTARGTNYGEEFKQKAYESSNMASVRKSDIIADSQKVPHFSYVNIGDKTYYADDVNVVAKFMIDAMNSKETLDGIEKELIAKVLKQRTNPDAPAELSADEAALFRQPMSLVSQLIQIAGQNIQDPSVLAQIRAQLIQIVGAKDGPGVFNMFLAGAEAMSQVMMLREMIMTTPAADATDVEKALFTMEVQILNAYLQGGLSSEIINFYKAQLDKMPEHVEK